MKMINYISRYLFISGILFSSCQYSNRLSYDFHYKNCPVEDKTIYCCDNILLTLQRKPTSLFAIIFLYFGEQKNFLLSLQYFGQSQDSVIDLKVQSIIIKDSVTNYLDSDTLKLKKVYDNLFYQTDYFFMISDNPIKELQAKITFYILLKDSRKKYFDINTTLNMKHDKGFSFLSF